MKKNLSRRIFLFYFIFYILLYHYQIDELHSQSLFFVNDHLILVTVISPTRCIVPADLDINNFNNGNS